MSKIKSVSDVFGKKFYDRHWIVFRLAREFNLALCGSTASALCRNKTDYKPNDLDFVCGSLDDLNGFLFRLNKCLMARKSHYRIFVNSQNEFCPKPSVAHARITSCFWIPICVFVIPEDRFCFFRATGGTLVQRLDDVKKAAEELYELDHKPRLAADNIDFDSDGVGADAGIPPYEKPSS
jgi:hypothetical protein